MTYNELHEKWKAIEKKACFIKFGGTKNISRRLIRPMTYDQEYLYFESLDMTHKNGSPIESQIFISRISKIEKKSSNIRYGKF